MVFTSEIAQMLTMNGFFSVPFLAVNMTARVNNEEIYLLLLPKLDTSFTTPLTEVLYLFAISLQ